MSVIGLYNVSLSSTNTIIVLLSFSITYHRKVRGAISTEKTRSPDSFSCLRSLGNTEP